MSKRGDRDLGDAAQLAVIADEAERTRLVEDGLLEGAPSTRPNRARAAMMSVRVDRSIAERIAQLAERSDLPVSALVRGWIYDGIAAEQGPSADARPATPHRVGDAVGGAAAGGAAAGTAAAADDIIDRVTADLQRLRRLARKAG